MRASLLTLLVAFTASGAPPAQRKIATLVVPADEASGSMLLRLEAYVNEALGEFADFKVRSTDEIFGLVPDDEATAALKRAETQYAESRTAYDSRAYEEAERRLTGTLREFGKAASALRSCGHLCDAVAMYGAVLQLRGDTEEARITLLDLLSLGPAFDLDRKRFSQDFLNLKATVATSRNAQLRGNLNVKTKPSGARIFYNNELVGYAPMQVQTLPIGKAVLRLERPGFKTVGRMTEVTPEDQEVPVDLVSSAAYTSYQGLMPRLAAEALKDKGGATMQALAKTLDLERAVVVGVKANPETERLEVVMSYVDLKTGKKFSQKKAGFEGDEYGQLKGEVIRMATALINTGDGGGGERVVRSSDPLDNKSGTDEWNAEDRGGKTRARDGKRRAGDPLDGVSGTEEW